MTRFHKAWVVCPHCANEDEVVIWERVDVAEDPDLKERLLKKDLQAFSCSNCQELVIMAEPLLYIDPVARRIIYYCPEYAELFARRPDLAASMPLPEPKDLLGDPASGEEAFHLRLVSSYNELIEKVHLQDAGLDDRLMELVKLALRTRLLEEEGLKITELYFLAANGDGLMFQLLDTEEVWQHFESARAIYDNASRSLASTLPPERGWMQVDAAWALRYVQDQT